MAESTATSSDTGKSERRIHERKLQWKKVYSKWDLDTADKLVWDADPWLDAFKKASSSRDGDSLRALRVLVLDGTRKACTPNEAEEFSYILPNGHRVVYLTGRQKVIDQCASNKMHTFGGHWDWSKSLKPATEFYKTQVEVVEGDCLEATERLIARGMNPVVLNMASDHTPGGGYKGGAGAQEENLFRRTNLLRVLANEGRWYDPRGKGELPSNKMYPLPDPSCMYTPKAWVLRSSEANGYAWLEHPYEVAFIASAAYRRPRLEKDNEHMIPKMAEGFAEKVRGLLWTVAQYGHDSAVLSAWGCGAFRNPPKHIAEIFQQVLAEDWIQGRFKNITFAIFDDHNARKEHNPDGNVQPFVKVFQASAKTVTAATASSSEPAQSSAAPAAASSSSPAPTTAPASSSTPPAAESSTPATGSDS